MQEVKQVIVVRKDLQVRKGKMMAQAAHASMKVIFDMFEESYVEVPEDPTYDRTIYKLDLYDNSPIHLWINGLFTKIVVSVDSEKELEEIYQKARELKIPAAMIVDAGLTEFKGVPTKTAVGIGPWWSKDIDAITRHLKLL